MLNPFRFAGVSDVYGDSLGMMTFDGDSGYYFDNSPKDFDFDSNAITCTFRFNLNEVAGSRQVIIRINGDGSESSPSAWINASDHSPSAHQNKLVMQVENSAGSANICYVQSKNAYVDGDTHTCFFAFNATTGTCIFYVDGVDVDDTSWAGRILTSGTMDSGGRQVCFGANWGGNSWCDGKLGYFGFAEGYLTNPTDFFDPKTGLQEIDETTWTEWGSQPLYWNKYGTMDDNKGSSEDLTEYNTITGPS